MKHRDKASLYQELAKLTEADFHLDRSLTLLLGQSPKAEKRAFLEGMKRGLEAGQGIAESITKNNAALVGGLELSLIEAGERSGKMAGAFNHLARYFSAMDAAARQARSALIYPLVLVHLAILLPELPAFIAAQDKDHPGIRMIIGLLGLWMVIIGGMGSIWGAVLGGLLIGFVEVAAIATLGANVVDLSVYGLLLLILIVRPQGLLGRPPGREKL